jgi:hypothetical protein
MSELKTNNNGKLRESIAAACCCCLFLVLIAVFAGGIALVILPVDQTSPSALPIGIAMIVCTSMFFLIAVIMFVASMSCCNFEPKC